MLEFLFSISRRIILSRWRNKYRIISKYVKRSKYQYNIWKLPYGLEEIVYDKNCGYEKYINIPKSIKKINNKEIDNNNIL